MSVPLCEVTKTGMSVDDGVEQPRSSMSLAETWAKRQWPTPPVGFIQSSDAVVVTSSVPADLGAVPSASAYDQGHVRFARDLMEQHAQMQMLVHEFVSQGMAFMQSHRQKLEQVTLKHRELAHQGTNTGHIPSTEKLHARTGDDVEHNPCPLASVVVKNDSASVCELSHTMECVAKGSCQSATLVTQFHFDLTTILQRKASQPVSLVMNLLSRFNPKIL